MTPRNQKFPSRRPKMPLETGQYLSELNANNPTPTDGASQGDDHLRLIKSVLKTTFPNVSGEVSGSHTELNAAVEAAATGASKLSDDGAFFNTNVTDGFTNPTAGEVDVKAGGEIVVKLKSDKSASFQGAVTATGPITGPGAIPIAGTIVWWSDTLPDASFGTYAWCNGATYLRSNTALFNILGTQFGAGDGSTTANLPDLRDNVPVGKSTMGGVSSAGRIISGVTDFVTSTLGAIFGSALHQLIEAETPTHTHDFTGNALAPHSHTVTSTTSGGGLGYSNGTNASEKSVTTSSVSAGTPTGTNSSFGGDGAHNNVQPSTVCNWIIRVA